MATRPSRRRMPAARNTEAFSVANNSNSRYDMSLPQNWSVAQLKAKLQRNNVSFNSTTKKSRLIQLCTENGLIHNLVPVATQEAQTESSTAMNISELVKTVSELQRNVKVLSESVSKMTKNDGMPSIPSMNLEATACDTNASVAQMARSLEGGLTGLSADSPQSHTEFGLQTPAIQTPAIPVDRTITTGFENMPAMLPRDNQVGYTQTRYGYSAESLPFIETVHPSLRKQIVEGKDVNLASLLIPYYTGTHSDASVSSKEKPDPRLNQDLSLPQFIQAFGIYKNIMCEAHPQRRQELDLYERDMVDMATRYNGKGFYEYHKMFSSQAAAHLSYSNIKIDWSVRNKTLFCNIFANCRASLCYTCNSSLHMSSFCPKLLEKGPNSTYRNNRMASTDVLGRVRVQVNGKEVCNNYNTVQGCQRPRCMYAHACLNCKNEHPQHKCAEYKHQTRKENKQK